MKPHAALLGILLLGACGGDGDGSGADIDASTGGGDGAPDGDCAALSLHDCRLRSHCVTDVRISCACDAFFSCRGIDEPGDGCAGVECDIEPPCCGAIDACDEGSTGSCGEGTTCAPPGAAPGCGACLVVEPDCADDTECAAGSVCDPVPCACDATLQCMPGCTDDSCPAGAVCTGGDHPRCVAAGCDERTPCPDDFDCEDGACTRRACEDDLPCDGYCVLGLCHAQLGECRVPAE
jgi:hypothetical protein